MKENSDSDKNSKQAKKYKRLSMKKPTEICPTIENSKNRNKVSDNGSKPQNHIRSLSKLKSFLGIYANSIENYKNHHRSCHITTLDQIFESSFFKNCKEKLQSALILTFVYSQKFVDLILKKKNESGVCLWWISWVDSSLD